MSETKTGLELLRVPFPAHQVGKLSRETSKQKEAREADKSLAVSCKECGGWHHKNAIHLDYVGHAALTDRLLDVDPNWNWQPLSFKDGLPQFDATGGLWIKLTICGMTRLGYGNAPSAGYKDLGSREKEVIGDALRNAAMRFGAALDLWHKGILHVDEETGEVGKKTLASTDGAADMLSAEQRAEVDRIAQSVFDALTAKKDELAFSNYKAAFDVIVGADAQAAFTSKFSSEQRTNFKKMRQAELAREREKKVQMLRDATKPLAEMLGQQA